MVNEENVVKDLAQADEVIKMIKMMNPDVRADLLMRIARMGQKMDENRREKNPVLNFASRQIVRLFAPNDE